MKWSGHPGIYSHAHCRDPAWPSPGQPLNCPASAPLGWKHPGTCCWRLRETATYGSGKKKDTKRLPSSQSPLLFLFWPGLTSNSFARGGLWKKHTSGAQSQGMVEALHSASPPKPKGLIPSAREKPGSPPADKGVHRTPQGRGRALPGSCTLPYRAGSRQGPAAPSWEMQDLAGQGVALAAPIWPDMQRPLGTNKPLWHPPCCGLSQHPCLFPAVSLHLQQHALQVYMFQPLLYHPHALRAF